MSETENKEKQLYENIQYSLRAPRYAVDLFKGIAEEFTSPGAAFERIVNEHAEGIKPQVKANTQTAEKLRQCEEQIARMTQENAERIAELEEAVRNKSERITSLENLNDENNVKIDTLQNSLDEKRLCSNQHVVEIDAINWLVLEEVAKREGKRRGQSWTPDDIINYFIEKRFIDGELNGDLDSLPDKVIDRLRESLKGKEAE